MALYKISSSRVNNIEATEYVGGTNELGLIWYDEVDGVLRLYNDQPGGRLIGGSGISSEIVNGSSNVRVYPSGPVAISVNGVANVAVFEGLQAQFDNVVVAGNITGTYFIGDGSRLTGLPDNYGNANVADFLPTYNGTFAANTVSATGNITGTYFIGNGALLTGISATGNYSNANVQAYLPIYTGNLVSLTGNVKTTANIQANYFVGNGSQLTGIVATDIGVLPSLTVTGNIVSGNVNTAGNVTAEFFIGDGSKLTGITAQGLPTQAGNTGLFLSTDGANVVWNGALGGSLTFNGGVSDSDEFGNDLDGGGAGTDYAGSTTILGGAAGSDYSLTLSSVALTGQAQDVIISPPPAAATSTGSKGQIAFDSDWLYICVANNTWKQVALSSW